MFSSTPGWSCNFSNIREVELFWTARVQLLSVTKHTNSWKFIIMVSTVNWMLSNISFSLTKPLHQYHIPSGNTDPISPVLTCSGWINANTGRNYLQFHLDGTVEYRGNNLQKYIQIHTILIETYSNIDIFNNYFQRIRDIHGLNIRNADDLHVPYGKLDVRKFSITIAGPNLWNWIPLYIKNSTSTNLFKRNMRAYLLDRKLAY